MSIIQGRLGKISIGGTAYPCYSWSMSAPRNLQPGAPVGNTFATNIAEGLQSTRVDVQFMFRTKSTELLSLAFWNLWMSRTFGSGFDDTAANTIIGTSGQSTYTLANCKAESFSVSIRKGQEIGVRGTFLAPALPTKAAANTATSYLNTVDSSGKMMFDQATISGFTGSVYGLDFAYSNNHLPNAPLDGTKFVGYWEAGQMVASASATVAEIPYGTDPCADGTNVTVAIAGARTFSLTSMNANNERDLTVTPGQTFQPLNFIVLGNNTPTAPLVIT